MKKILCFTFVLALVFSCQKEQIAMPDDSKTIETKTNQYQTGIAFYGYWDKISSLQGDAAINGISDRPVYVNPGQYITVQALPNEGYIIDHWLQYAQMPPLFLTSAQPPFQRVQYGKPQFSHAVTGETWFEPVFKEKSPSAKIIFWKESQYPAWFIFWIRVRYTNEEGVETVLNTTLDTYANYTEINAMRGTTVEIDYDAEMPMGGTFGCIFMDTEWPETDRLKEGYKKFTVTSTLTHYFFASIWPIRTP